MNTNTSSTKLSTPSPSWVLPPFETLSSEEDLFFYPWALSPLSTKLLPLLWSPLHHYKGLSFLSPASLLCVTYIPDICQLMTYFFFHFIFFQNRFPTLDLHLAFWYHREILFTDKVWSCTIVIWLLFYLTTTAGKDSFVTSFTALYHFDIQK